MMSDLTPEQRRAVTATGPVCVTASAGSGKTAVLVERFLREMEKGARPDQILAVTFTRKAGKQLRDRLSTRLVDAPEETRRALETTPWIGTLHGFCAKLVQQWGTLLGQDRPRRIVEPLERSAMSAMVCRRWLHGLSDPLMSELCRYWTPGDLNAMAQEALARPHDFECALDKSEEQGSELLRSAFHPLLVEWRKALETSEALTFDDLEKGALAILRNPAVATHYRQHFRAILVDEFQDTSPVQWNILQLVLGDAGNRLFVVGDPKQSIYRFRGADVRLFLGWNDSIRERGGEAVELATCFRSRPAVVEAVNTYSRVLFENTAALLSPMRSGREPSDSPGLEFHRYGGATSSEATIAERTLAAALVRGRIAQGTTSSEIALLFRNGDRMEHFARSLVETGVKVFCEPVTRLCATYEAQDMAAFLRAVANPEDEFALTAWLRSGFNNASLSDLAGVHSRPGTTLLEKLADRPEFAWFKLLCDRKEVRTQVLLENLFANCGFRHPRPEVFHQLLSGLADAGSLAEALERFSAWERLDVPISLPLPGSEPGGVRLLTVHGAKGLEFDEVFLVDCLRRPPSGLSWFRWSGESALGFRYRDGAEILASPQYDQWQQFDRAQDKDEALRIVYVALTRAKERLHVLLPADGSLIATGTWAHALLQGQPN